MGVWEWGHVAIGGVASLIFLFQSLGSADSDDASPGSETDAIGASDAADADGMAGTALSDYLSVRNFVAFFIGYGWVTFAGLYNGLSRVAASVAGTVSGIIFVFVSLFLLRAFLKFQEDGSLRLETLEGRRAYVYIAIMGAAANTGKVMVDTASGRVELPARTRDDESLRPGKMVKILGVEGGGLWVTAKE
ncbi:MAG: NfeD family protein [Synergistaceae bacterium]|nr:NfeD family protein [Synergistaceae bacterium]